MMVASSRRRVSATLAGQPMMAVAATYDGPERFATDGATVSSQLGNGDSFVALGAKVGMWVRVGGSLPVLGFGRGTGGAWILTSSVVLFRAWSLGGWIRVIKAGTGAAAQPATRAPRRAARSAFEAGANSGRGGQTVRGAWSHQEQAVLLGHWEQGGSRAVPCRGTAVSTICRRGGRVMAGPRVKPRLGLTLRLHAP